MELRIRRNNELGIQVQDEIVFHQSGRDEIVLGTGTRGSFDESPYSPTTTYWSYHADLYDFERILVVQIIEETKIVTIVDGDWNTSTMSKETHLLSQDEGITWTHVKHINVGEARPFSQVKA